MNNAKERTRFLKFAVVGAIGAVVDFGIMNLITALTPLSLQIAATISFVSAVISNFFLNRYWTFPESRLSPLGRQLLQFFIVSVIGWGFRYMTIDWFNHLFAGLYKNFFGTGIVLPFMTVTPEFFGKNFALATLILIVMLWNFFVNRFWTYKDIK